MWRLIDSWSCGVERLEVGVASLLEQLGATPDNTKDTEDR